MATAKALALKWANKILAAEDVAVGAANDPGYMLSEVYKASTANEEAAWQILAQTIKEALT